MAITGMRIVKAEITRDKNEMPSGIGINMAITELKEEAGLIEIHFTYRADYAEKVGMLLITGILFVEDEKKARDEIIRGWKTKKKLEDAFAEEVLNNINFACGAHGTLMARVVNLQPPLIPPRIRLEKSGAGASAA
ncbi:MAG: hypothetical protein Q7T16_00730 [Candidatus Burarchaeum sp.]|nr:hypothetical protein [Candidatus Burarchaeum sp.]MDO8339161.1 hypothetical protein [Candidatus Burarchaeum sp.]